MRVTRKGQVTIPGPIRRQAGMLPGTEVEFVIDGNLASVEYADRLGALRVPTLILVGDHDQCDPSLSRDMQARIPGARLVVLPESGHMTFVDQPALFLQAVGDFLRP